MRQILLRAGAIVVLLATALGSASPALSASDPPFVGWPALLAPRNVAYDPSSEDVCVSGRLQCADRLIDEMRRRNAVQLRTCDHDAVFALLYLRTTQEYRRYITGPNNFQDEQFMTHLAAVFGAYYFRAYDRWAGRRFDQVPPAWRAAFEAADKRTINGTGNLLLGMNAHINRDLPFVLEAVGLTRPDGVSRKSDHDAVNEFLNRVTPKAAPEVARRLDPTVDDGGLSFTDADEAASLQLVQAWREEAWRNAERLAKAGTPQRRRFVENSIEEAAELEANRLRGLYRYGRLITEPSSAARDAYCAVHRYDP